MDGRILVSCAHPTQGWGYYLMTRRAGAKPLYERIDCELAKKGLLDRISVSPSETKVCFEYQTGFEYKDPGRTLYIADFDVKNRTITNVKAIANKEGRPIWYAYPRWIEGEAAVVYHSYETGKGQLYVYRLEDGSTKRVSTSAGADYRYPHGEAAPS
jgi:Tol biopolymer transport system component